MPQGKVDADVLRQLDALAENVGDPRVVVVIEHAVPATVAGEGEPDVDLGTLTRRVRDLQQGILDQLGRMGVRDARSLVLANAVVAELTRGQVTELADRPDVRRIHLARPDQVITAGA